VRQKALRQNTNKPSKTAESQNPLPSISVSSSNTVHPESDPNSDLVTIARLIRPQGIKGEIIASIETDFPEHFEDLDSIFLVFPNGKIQKTILEDFWFHKDRIVLKLKSINSRTEAEAFRNVAVKIPSSELIQLPENEYYEFDLVGCSVVTIDGIELGEVKELVDTGAAPLLVINGIKEYLIPFAEEICTTIDVAQKKIIVNPPSGLLEL
jgi:16S rRNA processing protein RimM